MERKREKMRRLNESLVRIWMDERVKISEKKQEVDGNKWAKKLERTNQLTTFTSSLSLGDFGQTVVLRVVMESGLVITILPMWLLRNWGMKGNESEWKGQHARENLCRLARIGGWKKIESKAEKEERKSERGSFGIIFNNIGKKHLIRTIGMACSLCGL